MRAWFGRPRAPAQRGELTSISQTPAGGKAGSRPVSATAISQQSGWWPTVTTAAVGALDDREDVGGRRAGREPLVDPERAARGLRDRLGGLPRPQQRARQSTSSGRASASCSASALACLRPFVLRGRSSSG